MPSKKLILLATIGTLALVLIGSGNVIAQSGSHEKGLFEDKLLPALFNQQIREELELVDDQKESLDRHMEALKREQEALGRELREFARHATKEEAEKMRQEMIAQFEQQKSQVQADIMEVLLPHQKTRLRQVTAQAMLREITRKKKVAAGILVPEIKDYLEIDSKQSKQLEQKAKEINKRLAEEIRKLTESAQQELLGELSAKQRNKYLELIGEPISGR